MGQHLSKEEWAEIIQTSKRVKETMEDLGCKRQLLVATLVAGYLVEHLAEDHNDTQPVEEMMAELVKLVHNDLVEGIVVAAKIRAEAPEAAPWVH